jgi:putative nucleotidyltransferase with HDIG domain
MWSFVTLLSPPVTSFQGRNSLDAGFGPPIELRIPRAHPARVMLDALERVMALRDPATAAHAMRVRRLAVAVAEDACFGDDALIAAIQAAAPLHDIGKLAIPDRLLHKPGPLTCDEYDLVKRHAIMGADMLAGIECAGPIAQIIRHHHENWDGTGYPDALRGEAIPLGARILTIVDCYDALTSERPYRESLSHGGALEMIGTRRGTMYEPAILDAFLRVVQQPRSGIAVRASSPYRRHPVRVT